MMKRHLILMAAVGLLPAPAGALSPDGKKHEAAKDAYRTGFTRCMDRVKDKQRADAAAITLYKLQKTNKAAGDFHQPWWHKEGLS